MSSDSITNSTDSQDSQSSSFYELTVNDKKGRAFPFTRLRGNVVLVTNVTTSNTSCNEKNWLELEQLYNRYRNQGFEILAFPCAGSVSKTIASTKSAANLSSDPEHSNKGSGSELAGFVEKRFGVSFTILERIKVNGKETSDVYKYLKSSKKPWNRVKSIKLNFEKFLIDRNGVVKYRFNSFTSSKKVAAKIEKLLNDDYSDNIFYTNYFESYLKRNSVHINDEINQTFINPKMRRSSSILNF